MRCLSAKNFNIYWEKICSLRFFCSSIIRSTVLLFIFLIINGFYLAGWRTFLRPEEYYAHLFAEELRFQFDTMLPFFILSDIAIWLMFSMIFFTFGSNTLR